MKRLLATFVVLAIVATPVFASEWYGSADYGGNAFIYVIGPGAATYTSAISERFTAKRTVTGIRQVVLNTSGSGYGGAPMASVSIHADSLITPGTPGVMLGAASPVTAVGKNIDQAFVLGAPAAMTAGNVYHVKITNASPLITDKVRINMMGAPVAGQTDQKVEWGMGTTMGLDANMAGMYYLQGDLVYPDGWYEGKPAEMTKHWEPFFGLRDEQGVEINNSEGAKSGYDRAQLNKRYGTSFVVQNVPAPYVNGGKVEIGNLRVYTRAVGSALTDDLKITLRGAGGTEIVSGIIAKASVVAGWNSVHIAPISLTVGQRYQVTYDVAGTGSTTNTNYYRATYHKTGAVPQGDLYQQLAAYGIQSIDGGVTYTPTQDQDYMFGVNIPEPATLSLLVIGGMAVLARKRR